MFPLIIILLATAFYWGSGLSFFPVPWPDDSAFFLPAAEWFSWPSLYRMHSQAPWVPSYDLANFNTMPGMPLILGLGKLIGIQSVHGIRFFGMAVFAWWLGLLSSWMRDRKTPPHWFWLVLLSALTSPVVRWGAMVTRPEIWQGFIWVLILMDLDGWFAKPSRWRLPVLLASSAYLHFEAIVWLLPTLIGLYPMGSLSASEGFKEWGRRIFGLVWRTGLLLSPWLAYVLLNWNIFWEQMHTQFFRLASKHPYVDSWHSFFHSLFVSIGDPVLYPKYLNAGKGALWLLMVVSTVGLIAQIIFYRMRDPGKSSVRAAALAGLLSTFYLWLNKHEVWFIVLVHVAALPVIALFLADFPHLGRIGGAWWPRVLKPLLGAAAALLIGVQLAVTAQQWQGARKQQYSWKTYGKWADCIHQEIGDRQRVWQPDIPDILIELWRRNPKREYFRHVDFPNVEHLVREHWLRTDAVIHSRMVDWSEPRRSRREDATPEDIELLKNYPGIDRRELNALNFPGKARLRVCQEGPFWAAISLQDVKRSEGEITSLK